MTKFEETGRSFLSDLLSSLPYLKGGDVQYIEDEYGVLLVKKPSHIDESALDFDKWTHLDFGKRQKLMTRDQIKAYFEEEIIDARIKVIEDVPGNLSGWRMLCDYCNFPIPIGEYFYCTDCHKNMCLHCHSEQDAHNCTLHGEALYACQENHVLITQKWFNAMPVECELCGKASADGQKFYYSLLEDVYDANWDRKWDRDENVCETCWNSKQKSDGFVNARGGRNNFKQRVKVCSSMDCVGFGSLLDWIPILRDEFHNTVLVNVNTESAFFGKISACVVVNYGERAYFVLEKAETVEALSIALKEFDDDPEWNRNRCCSRPEKSPIPRVVFETYRRLYDYSLWLD